MACGISSPSSSSSSSSFRDDSAAGLPRWHSVKESACQCRRRKRHRFYLWVSKIRWRRKCQPTPVFLPGESHGQKSLVGYCPWDHKESDTPEQLCTHAHHCSRLSRLCSIPMGVQCPMAANSSLLGSVCSLLLVQVALSDLGYNSFQWTFMTGMLSPI